MARAPKWRYPRVGQGRGWEAAHWLARPDGRVGYQRAGRLRVAQATVSPRCRSQPNKTPGPCLPPAGASVTETVTPNNFLQQTGHARGASSRVSRLLSFLVRRTPE